jgi:hypothetical protein
MRKIAVAFLVLLMSLLSACTFQERVNPIIFTERLAELSDDIMIYSENSYYEENVYVAFADFKNIKDIAVKMNLSDNGTVDKISIISNNNAQIFEFIKLLINSYSPKEDSARIMSELKKLDSEFRYSFGNEYTYSIFASDKTIYFEVFSNSLSSYTVPDLTLKPNDKTEF